jgi:hypothetical protein
MSYPTPTRIRSDSDPGLADWAARQSKSGSAVCRKFNSGMALPLREYQLQCTGECSTGVWHCVAKLRYTAPRNMTENAGWIWLHGSPGALAWRLALHG